MEKALKGCETDDGWSYDDDSYRDLSEGDRADYLDQYSIVTPLKTTFVLPYLCSIPVQILTWSGSLAIPINLYLPALLLGNEY